MKFKLRKKWRIFLLVLAGFSLLLAIIWPKAPEIPATVSSLKELEAYLERLVTFGTPPGISVVVFNKDGIIYQKGFGWADKPQNLRATPETVYHWWSVTKIATAMAILQLQEAGKLQLDDPVAKYLPFFNVTYLSETSTPVTIRHLLNHSSGIPDAGFRIMQWTHQEGEPHVNQTAMIQDVFPDYAALGFEPGSLSAYTNIGYMVLGAIIEKVSQQPYEAYIRQQLLMPLGMVQTDFVYKQEMEPYEAAGSHPLFDAWTPLVPFIAGSFVRETSGNQLWMNRVYTDQTPPSGLIGSAPDAARLARVFLNKGMLDSVPVLSEASVAAMTFESHVPLADNPEADYVRQGLGWQIYKEDSGFHMEHTGGGMGFSTIMQIHPERNLGIIVFANSTKMEGWRIAGLASGLDWQFVLVR